MSTPKLLWHMVLRGCGQTAGIGALLGAGYGIILLATTMLALGDSNNAELPLMIVMAYAVLIAALFGAAVAGVIGLITGSIGGVLCGLMTRWFFMPLQNGRVYGFVARLAGGLYGALAIIVAVYLISTSGFAPPIVTWREAMMLYVFPAVLGSSAGIYISRRVTDVYRQVANSGGGANASQESVGAAKPA